MSDIRAVQIEHLKKLGYQFEEKDIPFPDENKLKLGVAILVDYKTPIDEQCQKLGIVNQLNGLKHGNRYSSPADRWGWIYQATIKVESGEFINFGRTKRADEAYCYRDPVMTMKTEGRAFIFGPLMTVEGLALYRENSELFKDRIVDFCGSACRIDVLDCDTSLVWNGGKPELDTNYVEIAI
jgi:hypothetical protein